MLELYFFSSPNGMKLAIMLEETGFPYKVHKVNIGRGEQFDPEYLKLNPNNKIPTLVDTDNGMVIFESGAELLYLAEKSGRFLSNDPVKRMDTLQWLFWQVGGFGPMAGQAHHFRAFASEKVPYGIKRYTDEMNRLYGVMNKQLSEREYLADDYSIADIACWPWALSHERQGQDLADFPNVERWFRAIAERPAVERAMEHKHERQADKEAYKFLYGQTASAVDQHTRERGKTNG
jgi:GST-like protein